MQQLDYSKAYDPDKISGCLLKETGKLLSNYPPSHIDFLSILEARPTPWGFETCKYYPSFKKGVQSTPANYRPISLTCITML